MPAHPAAPIPIFATKDRITLGRALSEAAIIVGSILLAFAIDASWDQYRERRDEQAVLANLEAEFVANLELLETVVRRHEGFAERAAELDAMSEDEVRAIPDGLVDGSERALGQWMTFEPRGGVLARLVGDGRLVLLFQVSDEAGEDHGVTICLFWMSDVGAVWVSGAVVRTRG